ncbi:hypothetical protein AVEN_264160-1 [Araneus ventricosus]|uniref:Uncharacterized protein n=1 Tax=Araneus ventricosus TaxID=182803 RepID=A0A4Y2NY72_ARAVE|nr:hypothetical protein AVEN_264160-1 [Araneus ventricosus]
MEVSGIFPFSARHSVGVESMLWMSLCGCSTYSDGLPRVCSRRESTPNHFKGSVSLTGTPAIHTKSSCSRQHCLCHCYSIVEAVFLLSKVSQKLVVTFLLSLHLSSYLFFRKKLVSSLPLSPEKYLPHFTTHEPAIFNTAGKIAKLRQAANILKRAKAQ